MYQIDDVIKELKDLRKHVLTKDDLKNELKQYPTKDDLKNELKQYATKVDLKNELKQYATKDDLKIQMDGIKKSMVTKDDLKNHGEMIIDYMDSFYVRDSRAHGMEIRMNKIEARLSAVEQK